MELKRIEAPTRCENGACPNLADYVVERSDSPVRMRLHLCRPCLKAITELGKRELGKPRGARRSAEEI